MFLVDFPSTRRRLKVPPWSTLSCRTLLSMWGRLCRCLCWILMLLHKCLQLVLCNQKHIELRGLGR